MLKQLILGSGAAGITAVKKLRELRPEDEVSIVSEEPYPPYSRCLLPDYIAGSISKKELFIQSDEFYQENNINLILEDQAADIDIKKHKVNLKSGIDLEFDKLLIATGSCPIRPQIPGIESERVTSLRNISDAERIIELASQSSRIAIIGGGFIGLETAYALRQREVEVVVLEMMPHILYSNMDETAAKIIADDLKETGVVIKTGNDCKVLRINEYEKMLRLKLGSNEYIDVDSIIHAVGVRPNVDIVTGTPIRVKKGILVDEYLETNIKGIYAAGDVAQAKDLLTGELQTTPIWPNAVVQAKCAAYNMTGFNKRYMGEVGLQNAMEFRHVPAIAFGLSKVTEADGFEIKRVHHPTDGTYKKVVLQGDVVKGMIFVGDISNAGIVTNFIKSQSHIGELKDRLIEDTFSLAYLIEDKIPVLDLYTKGGTKNTFRR